MHPICLDAFSPEQLSELDQLYHTSPDPRVRIRALMILLSAERHLVVAEIAALSTPSRKREGSASLI